MIRDGLTSSNMVKRIITLTILAFLLFFGVTLLSYFLLPEGFLANKNELTNFTTSSNVFLSTFQIFLWNMLSVLAILIASFFAKKKKEQEKYLSLSYGVYCIVVILAAITLGTWSFTSGSGISIPIFQRIISMFDLFHHAGLVELYGQLLITCALANHYLVMTYKNKTTTRNIKEVKWSKSEIISFVIGILLMLLGAFIESYSILNG